MFSSKPITMYVFQSVTRKKNVAPKLWWNTMRNTMRRELHKSYDFTCFYKGNYPAHKSNIEQMIYLYLFLPYTSLSLSLPPFTHLYSSQNICYCFI